MLGQGYIDGAFCGHRARADAALAQFQTVNQAPKTFCPFCTRSGMTKRAPLFLKVDGVKNFFANFFKKVLV
jgi:hypothetical protein